jgi:hypothetical protein
VPERRRPCDRLGVLLFAHGTRSIGLAPTDRWRGLLGRARVEGRFLCMREQAYPGDSATFARYQPALATFLPRRRMLPPLFPRRAGNIRPGERRPRRGMGRPERRLWPRCGRSRNCG